MKEGVKMKYPFLHPKDLFNDDCSVEHSAVVRYMRRNRDVIKQTIVDGKKYFIDTSTLSLPCCYNGCLKCVMCHGTDCCSGSPYSFDDVYAKRIDKIFPNLVEEGFFTADQLSFIQRYGYYSIDMADAYEPFDNSMAKTIRNNGEYCVFHGCNDNESYCILHRYALEHDIDPYEIKPPSCFLLPLDVIEFDNSDVLIFGYSEDTLEFTRWFDELYQFSCVNKPVGESFMCFKDYKPLYLAQEKFIRYFFSDELFEKICLIMEGNE